MCVNFIHLSTANVRVWSLQDGWCRASGGSRGEASQPAIDPGDQNGGKHVCDTLSARHEVYIL